MVTLALQETIEQKYTFLLHSALAVVHHPYDAEDAVQNACYKAWLHQQDILSEQAYLPWLRKIVFHECVSILRKRSRSAILMPTEEVAERNAAGDQATDFVQAVIVKDAMSTLADKYAVPLRLKYYMRCSITEIAQQMEIPLGTVKSRMHQGKRMLASVLGEKTECVYLKSNFPCNDKKTVRSGRALATK